MYSRRHIDLLRVAGALCPAYGDAASRHTAPPRTAL
ncbi:putative leader peptide [Streptomyces niveus]